MECIWKHELHVMGEGSDVVEVTEKSDITRLMVYIANKVRYISTYWFYSELLYCMCIKIKCLHIQYDRIPYPLQKLLWKYHAGINVIIVN